MFSMHAVSLVLFVLLSNAIEVNLVLVLAAYCTCCYIWLNTWLVFCCISDSAALHDSLLLVLAVIIRCSSLSAM